MSDRLEIRTLGGLTIRRGDEPVTGLASRKVEALLVYLACAARPRPREVLAEMLWEERSQERAMGNLRVALSSLRKRLGPFVTITREEAGVNPEADVWLDACELEQQLSAYQGQREQAGARVVDQIEEVVGLYQGDFLEGFYVRGSSGFENWAVLERERLRAAREQSLQLLLDCLLAGERWLDAIKWGESWIADGQTPEPAYRALMNAHSGRGDQASMTAAYQRCIEALGVELGIEPSEQTGELYKYLASGGRPSVAVRAEPEMVPAPTADRAVQALLARWRRGGAEVLDVASLAVLYASSGDIDVGPNEADLLIRSALHHGVDLEPWLERVGSPGAGVQALNASLERYPKPRVRMQIVEALKGLPGDEAVDVLQHVAIADDAPAVRTEAALAAAGKGRREAVLAGLLDDLRDGREAVALPAFVAVADEYGLPADVGPYPRGPVAMGLARRRWRTHRRDILRQTMRAGVGGALAMVAVAIIQFLPALIMRPASVAATTEVVPLPIWMATNVIFGLIWGGAQGGAIGLTVGLCDGLLRQRCTGARRYALGSLAGLVLAGFNVFLSFAGGLAPVVPPATYVPVFLAYGLWFGGALSLVVPRLGSKASRVSLLPRSALASAVEAAAVLPTVYVVHGGWDQSAIIQDLTYALLFPLGLALVLGGRRGRGGD